MVNRRPLYRRYVLMSFDLIPEALTYYLDLENLCLGPVPRPPPPIPKPLWYIAESVQDFSLVLDNVDDSYILVSVSMP